jgi:hypothetical protein
LVADPLLMLVKRYVHHEGAPQRLTENRKPFGVRPRENRYGASRNSLVNTQVLLVAWVATPE